MEELRRFPVEVSRHTSETSRVETNPQLSSPTAAPRMALLRCSALLFRNVQYLQPIAAARFSGNSRNVSFVLPSRGRTLRGGWTLCSHARARSSFCCLASGRYHAAKMDRSVTNGYREEIAVTRISKAALAGRFLRSCLTKFRKLLPEVGLRAHESSARWIV
jgi:hypothetical protein